MLQLFYFHILFF